MNEGFGESLVCEVLKSGRGHKAEDMSNDENPLSPLSFVSPLNLSFRWLILCENGRRLL